MQFLVKYSFYFLFFNFFSLFLVSVDRKCSFAFDPLRFCIEEKQLQQTDVYCRWFFYTFAYLYKFKCINYYAAALKVTYLPYTGWWSGEFYRLGSKIRDIQYTKNSLQYSIRLTSHQIYKRFNLAVIYFIIYYFINSFLC